MPKTITSIIVFGLIFLAIAAYGVFLIVGQTVEKPAYTTVETDGAFEIRDYPPLIVAEVERSGSREEAVNAGFRPLARYIFASEREGESIAMTAPVTQEPRDKIAMTAPVTQEPASQEAGENTWIVRFIMPAGYSMETLPAPVNPDVRLVQVPARRMAAIRFSGIPETALMREKEDALRAWLRARGLGATGAATYAYYNDPFTPGFLRRNEVLIEITGTPQPDQP